MTFCRIVLILHGSMLHVVLLALGLLGCGDATVELVNFGVDSVDSQFGFGSTLPSVELPLGAPVVYNGVAYESVFVNPSGFVSFGNDQEFVVDQNISQVDSQIIAPFWADIDTTATVSGGIFYRISTNQSELVTLSQLIRRYFPNSRFSATDLLVVTWDRVGHYDGGTDQNTVQVVIATDGVSSYALFLYADLQWAQSDPRSSIAGSGSGSGSLSTFAQAGLVYGSTSYILPWSGTENITLLTSTSNIGQEGSWLFRIDKFTPAALCSDGDARIKLGSGYDYVYGLLDYEDFYYSDPDGERRLTRGAVETCLSQTWGTVCSDGWEDTDASVVCRQLQFSPYGALAVEGGQFSDPGSPILISTVACSGEEDSLLDCSPDMLPTSTLCSDGQVAGVVCQESSTLAGNCSDGGVRLVGGANNTLGRVEVCLNNAWGTVCNSRFGTNEARVICQQLGFERTDVVAHRFATGMFGLGSGPIFLENLACNGEEGEILDCPRSVPGLHQCDHSQDAGVQCYDIDQCLSNNGGCEQLCINQAPGFVCGCNQGYKLDDNGITCSDDPSCSDGDVRLVNGTSPSEGRVEVCSSGTYSTVCDDFWDELDAQVVCRQLGFSTAAGAVPVRNAYFGEGSGTILLDDVNCGGSESTLLNCTASQSTGNCSHSEDAGVRCAASCTDGAVRLIVSDSADYFYMGLADYDSSYYDKDGLRVGRVEVCVDGRYGSICYDSWDNRDASVVCRQLGFSPYGAIAVNADSFSEGSVDRLLSEVECFGNESEILNCSSSKFEGFTCTTSGVVCQAISTPNGMCVTGESRLQVTVENITSDGAVLEGRLELCVNNAWGTICDTLFGPQDAAVACSQLSGFTQEGAEVLERGSVASGSGPIFLSDLNCEGTEASLLQCMRQDNQPAGLHNCAHQQDVAIRCTDVDECQTSVNLCEHNCTNTLGSFECVCDEGFTLNEDLLNCDDIDECAQVPGPCAANASCTNTVGSYSCTCDQGYTGDGVTNCSSINECESPELNNCHPDATCTDTLTSFVCMCNDGFTGNGTDCMNIVCSEGAVRVTNEVETTLSSGRVEVCVDNAYRFVCSDRWDEIDATVVCAQLNLSTSNVVVRDGALFASANVVSGSPVVDDVVCNGDEDSILQCSHSVVSRDCATAGVICANTCVERDVHLAEYSRLDVSVSGEVQVCSSAVFAGVCDVSWDNRDASVVCRQLGFSPYGAIGSRGGAETEGTVLTDVQCSGAESTIRDCPVTNSIECSSQEIATVVCQDIEPTSADCVDGAVRLVNGSNPLEGRVEVCFNNAWGTVCSNQFDSDEAQVVCNQLSFPFEMAVVLTGAASFGAGSGPVFVERLRCDGTERSILDCTEINTRRQSCTHQLDVSIQCSDVNECLLDNGNCSDVCVNDVPFYQCECPTGAQLDPANNLTCVFNADCSQETGCECLPGYRNTSTDSSLNCTDMDECAEDFSCPDNFQCINVEGNYSCICDNGFFLGQDNLTCACNNGDLRLVNGSTVMEGRVEVCMGNSYGTVCDDRWDVLDARVACRQLGFSTDDVVPLYNGYFGEGAGAILLDDVRCIGNESQLVECTAETLDNCDHSEDAGVRCGSTCVEGDVRLLVGEDYQYYLGESMLSEHYYGKDELLRGRVEVCVGGRYGTVCDDFWDNPDASVVCRQLGHSPYGAVAVADGIFAEGQAELLLSAVQCNGSESHLLSCEQERLTHTGCGPLEDAGVVCQAISTVAGDCEDGQVRLRDGDMDEQNLLMDGRLEICVNNAWGTVCNNSFRQIDAEVACDQLEGFQREGAMVVPPRAVLAEGPIFLDELFCTASDTDLLECSRTIGAVGLVTCSHSEDVWIQCTDIDECIADNGMCGEHGCVNYVGGYNCSCLPGYRPDENGQNCTNINECEEDIAGCDVNAECMDTPGNFSCVCKPGYTGAGVEGDCADVDECVLSMCHPNAMCVNSNGSFYCLCGVGFTGDGIDNCSNINECELNNCDMNALCEDTEGGFDCICNDGYSGNGTFCSCNNGEVRLMNGSVPSLAVEGRVEVCYDNVYSTVCDDLWDERAAQVVCRDFSMSSGAALSGIASPYGSGNGSILLDNVVCTGTEDDLLHCAHNPLFENNCDHSEDAAVVCGVACQNGNVRLVNNDVNVTSLQPVYDFVKDEVARGKVEVCVNNVFGTVCDESWDDMDASVVCSQLGFSPFGAIAVTRNFYSGPTPPLDTVLSGVTCTGNETSLSQCGSTAVTTCAAQQQNAGVICQDPAVTVQSNCSDGAVRLVNGSSVLEGRVEVCINNAWGTVCDTTFSEDEADVICSQAGFTVSGSMAFRDAFFGEGSGPILLERYDCKGGEEKLIDCASEPIGHHSCDHSSDAGVRCIDVNECDGNPCHEYADCVNTLGGFNCTCADNFIGNGFDCTRQCEDGFRLQLSQCVCNDGDLRITGDSSVEGSVEICMDNMYGAVCDDFWDAVDARVVCSQLGFTNDSQPLTGLAVTSPILLDNVQCAGTEESLLDCPRSSEIGVHNCGLMEGAGVRCGALCREGDVRVCVDSDGDCVVSPSDMFLIDDRLSVGRVEVCSGGRYGTICDDVWTDQAASVACRQLGFSPFGAIGLTDPLFPDQTSPVAISSLSCAGNETELFDCSFNNTESCGPFEDAVIICQEPATPRADCTTGSVRLADTQETSSTIEGRVEVCINQAWGTVCNTRFDEQDAGTVCEIAGGYLRSASLVVQTSMPGADSRPIFLDNLDCTTNDTDILECNRFSLLGIHSCTHAQDVVVQCTDIDECESNPCDQGCVNNVGSFQCECDSGYELSEDGIACLIPSIIFTEPLTSENAEQVFSMLTTFVDNLPEDEQSEGTLRNVSSLFDQVDDLISSGNFSVTNNFTESSVTILDGITQWSPEVLAESEETSGIVESFETILSGRTMQPDFTRLETVRDQLSVTADTVNMGRVEPLLLNPPALDGGDEMTELNRSNATTIAIPPNAFPDSNFSYVLNHYATSVLFQLAIPESVNSSEFNVIVDTEVIGFLIPEEPNVSNLSMPVTITLQSFRGRNGEPFSDPVCVSWDFNAIQVGNTTRGNWTTDGCSLVSIEEDMTFVCACNHLTNFAVLVNTNAPQDPVTRRLLEIGSKIGSTLSIVGLILTIITLLLFKKIRKRDASKFHVQLSIALLLMFITFMAGIDQTDSEIGCTAVSSLIQYFTLTSVFWMGGEAVLMFKKLIIVFGETTTTFLVITSLICWGVPVIFPATGLATLATGSNYLILPPDPTNDTPGYCFISDNRVRYGIFMAPLLAVLLFNIIMFIMVTRVLIRHTKKHLERRRGDADNKKTIIATVKTLISIFSVMVTFGLSWVFGAFSISSAALVFQVLFVIFSSTQGFMMFLFFCVINKDSRKEWKKFLTCYRYDTKTTYSSSKYSTNSHKSKSTSLTTSGSRNNSNVALTGKIDLESSITKLEMKDFTDSIDEVKVLFSNGNPLAEGVGSVSGSQQIGTESRPRLELITEQTYIESVTEENGAVTEENYTDPEDNCMATEEDCMEPVTGENHAIAEGNGVELVFSEQNGLESISVKNKNIYVTT